MSERNLEVLIAGACEGPSSVPPRCWNRTALSAGLLLLLVAVGFLSGAANAHAQLEVRIQLPRRLYMLYEPVIATVSIRNVSGRDIVLRDSGSQNWFGFEVTRQGGRQVAPRSTTYSLQPLDLGAGETLSRTINLTPLFALQELGTYRVRSVIYFADLNRVYASGYAVLDIAEGRVLRKQSVGVPDSRQTRDVSLMAFRMPEGERLYIRIVDSDRGIVYCNTKLGRLLTTDLPQMVFGRENSVHVLHPAAPRQFLYTELGLDGKVVQRKTYLAPKTNPRLTVSADNVVNVVGGVLDVPVEESADSAAPPAKKLSDRPPGLPAPKE